MDRLWNSAFGLLLVTGGLLGAIFPLGKLATEAGVSPAVWSFLISFGTGSILLISLFLRGKAPGMGGALLRFYFIAGAISYAIPNLLIFAVIPHLGAGYTGIMFTLSPVLTLLFSILLRLRGLNLLGLVGIMVGFVGALTVALTRNEGGQMGGEWIWVVLALLIPVSLAIGNVYRTIDWPAGAGPIELAAGSHLAAALFLVIAGMFLPGGFDVTALAAVPIETLVQVIASAVMFVFFFRLQAVGGPLYLSQIGYVAAAIGLFSGTMFLGESYPLLTWIGAGVISIGIVLTSRAQRAAAVQAG